MFSRLQEHLLVRFGIHSFVSRQAWGDRFFLISTTSSIGIDFRGLTPRGARLTTVRPQLSRVSEVPMHTRYLGIEPRGKERDEPSSLPRLERKHDSLQRIWRVLSRSRTMKRPLTSHQ